MIYTLSSELRSRGDVLRIGRQVEKWCRTNMGINGRKKYQPVIAYYKSMEGDNDMGEYRYWDNEIIVYYNNTPNVKAFIQTIIHEWQHQLQPMTKYEGMDERHGYHNNPMEIEAMEAEQKYYKRLWKAIKPKINK